MYLFKKQNVCIFSTPVPSVTIQDLVILPRCGRINMLFHSFVEHSVYFRMYSVLVSGRPHLVPCDVLTRADVEKWLIPGKDHVCRCTLLPHFYRSTQIFLFLNLRQSVHCCCLHHPALPQNPRMLSSQRQWHWPSLPPVPASPGSGKPSPVRSFLSSYLKVKGYRILFLCPTCLLKLMSFRAIQVCYKWQNLRIYFLK